MAELRWLLLVLGLVAIVGIYLYTKFKPRLERGIQTLKPRREPMLVDQVDAAVVPPVLTEVQAPESESESEPDAEVASSESPPTELPPTETKIVTIRLMARTGRGFPGEKLILAMRALGLRHGEFGIFHRPADTDDRGSEFSVASLTEPGSFDLTQIRSNFYPGVSIFLMLPGARDGVEIFDDMMQTSRTLAREMDGELLDEQGSSLSVQRERYLREEIIQFEHQGVS